MVQRKPYHLNDKLLKNLAEAMELIFEKAGIQENVLHSVTNEYIQNANKYILDYPCLMTDGVLRDIEFQSTPPNKKDIENLVIYDCLLNFNHGKPTELFVVALYKTDEKEIVKRINDSVVFRFPVICLKHINGDKKLKIITEKINSNQPLTEEEKYYLYLMPLFETTKPSEEVLEDIIHLTNKLDPNSKEFYKLKSIQPLYVEIFIKDKEKRKELWEVIGMKVNIYDEIEEYLIEKRLNEELEKGRKEGKEEGIYEGLEKGENIINQEWIKKLLDKNFSIEDIIDISGFSKDKILELTGSK